MQFVLVNAVGKKAFESGDFKTTLENLEKVIVQAAPDDQLESVFYTLGAAYFNLPDYPKAITAFQNYQIKYPKAARFNGGSLAIGQALSLSEKFTEAAVHYQTLENVTELRERALALEASAYEKAGDNEKALGLCDLDEKGRDPHAVELSGHKVTPLLEQRSRAAAASVATKGISLIRNRSGLVPLRIDKTKKHLLHQANNPISLWKDSLDRLVNGIRARNIEVTILENGNCLDLWNLEEKGGQWDAYLVVFSLQIHQIKNTVRPVGPMAEVIWTLQNTDTLKPVVISFGTPYLLNDKPFLDTLINCHSP